MVFGIGLMSRDNSYLDEVSSSIELSEVNPISPRDSSSATGRPGPGSGSSCPEMTPMPGSEGELRYLTSW